MTQYTAEKKTQLHLSSIEEEDGGNSLYQKDALGTLLQVTNDLSRRPALVNHQDIDDLTHLLESAFHKETFILQAGDCAERFSDARQEVTQQKYEQLILLKSLLENRLQRNTIVIGRIAGQYAKPRSNPMELIDDQIRFAYHGDMINSENLSDDREPDPSRILQAYSASSQILSHLANLQERIFTSHECFLLEYEEALTRITNNHRYNLGAHLLWLGMRNSESKKHVRYLASIQNPVAIKVSNHTKLDTLLSVIQQINPENMIGKLVLVVRLGTGKVDPTLSKLVNLIQAQDLNVLWMSDPMHGNIQKDQYGRKYRILNHVVDETIQTSKILNGYGIHLSGLHLEISPKINIHECVSSIEELTDNRIYESALDPRFNHHQCVSYIEQIIESL